MTPAPRICFCGNFPELQDKFILEVSAQRKKDPLAPLTVIVSSHLLGLSVKRELAWAGCNFANVRFTTLGDLAGEIAEREISSRGLRRLNDVTRDAIMARAIGLCSPLNYFEKIASREGFRRAAWRTLDGLRSAGLTQPMLRALADRLSHPLYQTLQRKVTDLIAIWDTLATGMAEHGFADNAIVLDIAAHAANASSNHDPFIFYGLTEFSELEKRFVATLINDRDETAFLPYRDGDACAWVRPLRNQFVAWGFKEVVLSPRLTASDLLSRIQLGLFEEITPNDHPAANDDSLLVVSAPSREREAEETVRHVLHSPLANSQSKRRTAVLLRESEPYTGLLRSGFARAGIKGYFHECLTLAETSTGRALTLLAALLDEKFRRATVMEFLLCSPAKWPQALADPLPVIPAAEWNQFSLLAGIVSRKGTWQQRLQRLRNRLVAVQDHVLDDEEAELTFHAERLVSLDGMIRYMDFLFARIAQVSAASSWRDAVTALWSLLHELIEKQEEDFSILDKLTDLHALDSLGTSLTPDNLRQRVVSVLAHGARRTDRFQADEPTVAPMASCAGILFDEVIIPGMVEKEIPRPVPADPLLLDEERELLQKLLDSRCGVVIPTFKREHEREKFLFHSAVSSARNRIVLSYPRHDGSTSRDRLPSTFLLKLVESVRGETTDYAALDSFIGTSAHGHRIPVSRLRASTADRAVTESDYHEAMLGAALEAGTCQPLLYLIESRPFFARAIEADLKRFAERSFTRYDGVITDPVLQRQYREWFASHAPAIQPKHFEEYARCPFRYFVERTLEVSTVAEPPELQRITPYERAIVMRDILELFYRQEQAMDKLPLQQDSLSRLHDHAVKRCAQYERESNTGAQLLWQIDRDRMLRVLKEFISSELTDVSGFVPTYFAHRFVVTTGDDNAATFSGRLDRIDVTQDGRARVITYKTGKVRSGRGDLLMAGQSMHLPVYRLAAAEFLGDMRVESASDLYVSSGTKARKTEYTLEDWKAGREIFDVAASTIRRYINDAVFFPFPAKTKCGKCPVRTACGVGRMTPKWNYDLPETRAFRSLVEAK